MTETTTPDPEREPDTTDANPADFTSEEIPPGHDRPTPGAPTAAELAADRNLFPDGTPDEIPDGTQPTGADPDTVPDETGDPHADPEAEA